MHYSILTIYKDTVLFAQTSPDDVPPSQRSVIASPALSRKDQGDPGYSLMMW